MIDTDKLAHSRERYTQALNEIWAETVAQWPLVSGLGLRHGETMSRSQAETAGAAMAQWQALLPQLMAPNAPDAWREYVEDCSQRWVLFLETLCRRGDACIAREKEGFKPVLAFDYDMIVDGRRLDRPVNYALVRIKPPAGMMAPR